MSRKREFIIPTDTEDAAINAGIAQDADNPELTDRELRAMVPAQRATPALAAAKRVRGAQQAPVKMPVSIRLDRDLIDRLKADGPGWQKRANDMLRVATGLVN
ncbi:BrnA antitoxin family protein [Acetobacter sacchari]|uniref:BrnA antitoxin family protein n=1 Tax=Acetobacter sacchari TaxID=2661687 RepID=UPI001FAF3D89|nr:BrnA antitoxin family protein [Acetobacter sacchari]